MSTTIYCMTHKKFAGPGGDTFVPLHVGKTLSDADFGYMGDDTGDNISAMNPNFGELTGIYWIWKNSPQTGNVGVCHYRRFFATPEGGLLYDTDVEEILKDHDLIAPIPHDSSSSNEFNYCDAHQKKDWDAVRNAIGELHPEYLPDFDAMAGDTKCYYANLSIMPRKLFDEYCQWLFSIIFHAWDHIDISGYDLYQARVMGFLSEVLLIVWTRHNNLKVYESRIITTDEKAETKELKLAVANLLNQGKVKDARELFLGIINIRPDITLPMSDILGEIPIIDHILYIASTEEDEDVEGLMSLGKELSALTDIYKDVCHIFSAKEGSIFSEEEKRFLETNKISPIASAVILMGDIYSKLRIAPPNRGRILEALTPLYSKEDMEWIRSVVTQS